MIGGIECVAVDTVFVVANSKCALVVDAAQYADAIVSLVIVTIAVLVIA